MSFFVEGNLIENEFDFFCWAYQIDGALKVMMKKVYEEFGDLGSVEATLLQMGHEGVKKEVLEHTWSNARERFQVSKFETLSDEERALALKSSETIKRALILGRGKEHEGD